MRILPIGSVIKVDNVKVMVVGHFSKEEGDKNQYYYTALPYPIGYVDKDRILTVKVEAERTDGALDVANVNVIAVVPYFVMKTAAMGRGKAKDAYDLYFLIKHYSGGIEGLAHLFGDYKESKIIQEMKAKLNDKFASPDHAGPVDVAAFLDLLDEDEIAFTKRDAYEQVQALIRRI